MKKLIPVAVLGGLVLMLTVSWANVAQYKSGLNAEFNRHIQNAESFVSKKVYIDAVKEYERALEFHPDDYDLSMKIVDLYDKLDNNGSYVKACENAITIDPTQPKPYLLLADRYLEKIDYRKAYDVLHRGEEKIPDNKDILSRIKKIKSEYSTLSMKFDTFYGFQYDAKSTEGYAKVEDDGKFGLLKGATKLLVKCEYDDIGLFMNKLIPVKKGGEWFYITQEGYRKLVTDRPADWLGSFSSQYAPAKIDGKYGYIDTKAKEYQFEYDDAGCFANGVAPVMKGD